MTTRSLTAAPTETAPAAGWPDVWGPGQLLAFSGLDGPVDFRGQLVLQTAETPGDFHLRLPLDARLRWQHQPNLKIERLLGDLCLAHSDAGPLQMAFLDSRTLIGTRPADLALEIGRQPVTETLQCIADQDPQSNALRNITTTGQQLFAIARGERWAVFSLPADESPRAQALADAALGADLPAALAARSTWLEQVSPPAGLDAAQTRLFRKALSVMKVNQLSAAGHIARPWSTPDRWPHRDMWLWDSAFHGVGMAAIDPALAQEILLAMLEQADSRGFMPLKASPFEPNSPMTQPPVLAWAVEKVLAKSGDQNWARQCLPFLSRYLAWNQANRDANRNDLLEWHIEGNPLCRSGESGMDNSPRFDRAEPLDAVDFSVFFAADHAALARIAERVGEPGLAQASREQARRTGEAIEALLWNEAAGFYCDRDFAGHFSPVLASSGFLPLLTEQITPQRVQRLAEHLKNPATFGAPLPVPSVALQTGTFCKDMWRGPTWININVLIAEGFERHGYRSEAQFIRQRSLEAIAAAYAQGGAIYEYYDALDVTHPSALDRKQRLARGVGMPPISDFHWTAALTVHLLTPQ